MGTTWWVITGVIVFLGAVIALASTVVWPGVQKLPEFKRLFLKKSVREMLNEDHEDWSPFRWRVDT